MELYIKSLHLIFVVTWFAALFYLVRLFVYHAEAGEGPRGRREILIPQFQIMERRLWYGIAWPSAVLTLTTGSLLLVDFWPLTEYEWLMIKLVLVALLFLYHLSCGYLYRRMIRGIYPLKDSGLRLWNEIPTLFLFGIIFLAVCKDELDLPKGGLMLALLGGLLWGSVRFYKYLRERAG